MKEEEALPAARGRTIALVQQRNAVDRERQQIVVFRQGFAGCVQPIGEQGKAQVSIRIREVMNFQPLDLLFDFLRGSSAAWGRRRSFVNLLGRLCAMSSRGSFCGPSKAITERLISAIARSEAGTEGEKAEEQEALHGHTALSGAQQR